MTFWNKIVLGTKFLFRGFEPATDYLCGILNAYINRDDILARIDKVRSQLEMVLGYMRKYKDYCPGKWLPYYEKLVEAIETLLSIMEDNRITAAELNTGIELVKNALAEWMAD